MTGTLPIVAAERACQGERLFEVGPQVIHVLQADREPKQRRWELMLGLPPCTALDQALNSPQARAGSDEANCLADRLRPRCASDDTLCVNPRSEEIQSHNLW